jgi:hypothetical protein
MTAQEPAAPKDSSAARTRAYRARLKAAGQQRADLPPCQQCGRPILASRIQPGGLRDQSALGRLLCAPCWRRSPDGQAAERLRDSQRRERGREGRKSI